MSSHGLKCIKKYRNQKCFYQNVQCVIVKYQNFLTLKRLLGWGQTTPSPLLWFFEKCIF